MRNDNRKSEQDDRWEKYQERGFATPEHQAPQAFVDWWMDHDHCPKPCHSNDGVRGHTSGITAHKAWQMKQYRDEFKERRHERASGTGLNYAYWGWWRNEDPPRTSNPTLLEKHRQWCLDHKRIDPTRSQPIPDLMKEVRSFSDARTVLDMLADKMDMNKAIGWTKADSEALQ